MQKYATWSHRFRYIRAYGICAVSSPPPNVSTYRHSYLFADDQQVAVTSNISVCFLHAYSLPRKYFIASVSSLLGSASKCGSWPFSENSARPLSAPHGRNQRVLREVEHSYLIDEVLCKFYCAGSQCAGTRTEFISRWKRADYTGCKSYSRAFHRLQVCLALWSASDYRMGIDRLC